MLYNGSTTQIATRTSINLWYVGLGGVPPVETGFLWPFDPASIDSEWGYRIPPVPGLSDFHSGADWAQAGGTPIKAAGDGVVSQVRRKNVTGSPGGKSWGNRVIIDHGNVDGDRLYTGYAHMQDASFPYVSEGQEVAAGDVIGYVGTTGSSTGNHLHFTCFINGLAIGNNSNPLNCTNPRDFMALYNPSGAIA